MEDYARGRPNNLRHNRASAAAVGDTSKKGEIRMVLRMFQDGPRMDIAQHPSSPEDGFKDGN